MTTALDRIEHKLDLLLSRQTELLQLTRTTLTEALAMASNQEQLQAAVDQLNTTTSQEAALLIANAAKLDTIGTLITDLVNTEGVPQSILDKAAAIQSALNDVVSTTTAQAGRLDALGVDPRNPVPVKPPAA